ncbi:glutamine amidotransferase [Cupriavidus sp. USMAA2-4]|uniref:glutamine amidotransferase n=1 Tax=Cupriavidus sp. USMAA2-4 TaxID=876364 RepID=UPI0008A66D5D|nr:glutamine amidotransferase [Cupriavidus sp. USMAA2-4]AOY94984.1 glutamine amidotransferase [Cupriavidus sp. USMAA2-4]
MKIVLAIRHIHFEDLGTLEPLLRARGYHVRYVDPAGDDLAALDVLSPALMVVLGGPVGAFDEPRYPWLAAELRAVRVRLEAGRPLLGICLGAQLMARALGAAVRPMGVKEIGFAPLALSEAGQASALAGLQGAAVLHWHGDQFAIPDGAQCLAGTAACPNQAFAVGPRVLGLQCHLEADAGTIEGWLLGHACELELAGIDPRMLRAQAIAHGQALAAAAQRVFGAWLDGFEAEDAAAPAPVRPAPGP